MPTTVYSPCSCCGPVECCGRPALLYATISATGGCACMDGVVIPLGYSTVSNDWSGGSPSPCYGNDCGLQLSMDCTGGQFVITGFEAGTCTTTSYQCDPLQLVFTCTGVEECCDTDPFVGTVTITVTL